MPRFCCGDTRPKTETSSSTAPSSSRSSGSSRASNGAIRARHADPPRDRADRARIVAGDDHATHALLREIAQRVGRVGPDLVPRTRAAPTPRARRAVPRSTSAASVRASSSTRCPSAASGRHRRARDRRPSRSVHTISGAPSTHVPRSPNVTAAPLATRGEGRRAGALPTVRRGERLAAARSASRCGSRRRPSAPSASDTGSSGAISWMRSKRDDAFGQRARLVEQDHVDARQAFDRGQLLHKHLAPGERDRGDTEREARRAERDPRAPWPRHRRRPPRSRRACRVCTWNWLKASSTAVGSNAHCT